MSDRRKASSPSLEQLLRVKRAERPDDAFWDDFDRKWEQRRLQALVEPARFPVAAIGLWGSGALAALVAVAVVLLPAAQNALDVSGDAMVAQAPVPVLMPVTTVEAAEDVIEVAFADTALPVVVSSQRFIENAIPAAVTPSPRFRAAPMRATLATHPVGYVRDHLPARPTTQSAVLRGSAF